MTQTNKTDRHLQEPLVSVVLPAYNECGNIVPLIREIKKALAKYSKEILVVDDNSPDGTAEAVHKEFSDDSEVRVIVRKQDPSLGRSIGRGIKESVGKYVAVMDTDFNHQPCHLDFMIRTLSSYSCVMGSRFLYGSYMQNRTRLRLSWLFNLFVRFTTGGDITDNLYGYFAIHRDLLNRYDFEKIFYGYGEYFIRLLFYLERDKLDILQFPAIHGTRRSGEGNKAFFSTFRIYLVATLRLTWEQRFIQRNKDV